MITLNQLISLYQDIGSRHKQVNDFMAVQDFNIEMDRAPTYPLLVVNPVSANMPKSEGGYTVFNTTLELQVLDLVNKDNNNRMDVMSDTQQIIADIVTEFSTHPYYIDNSIDTVSDISFDPIRGAYGGDVDGWKISVTLEHPVKLSYCGAPVENIQGFDFNAPNKVTVTDGENPNSPIDLYGGDTYTCIAQEPKLGIQYKRPLDTLVTTSYAIYDDGWQRANGKYNYPRPTNPLYSQELDVDTDPTGNTLLYNNAFGNKIRFTDESGVASLDVQNIYTIDNLTGLGYYVTANANNKGTWADTFGVGGVLEQRNADNFHGYNDYFCANLHMLDTLTNYQGLESNNTIILPYRRVFKDSMGSSNVRPHPTTGVILNRFYLEWQVGIWYAGSLTGFYHMLMTRIHF